MNENITPVCILLLLFDCYLNSIFSPYFYIFILGINNKIVINYNKIIIALN